MSYGWLVRATLLLPLFLAACGGQSTSPVPPGELSVSSAQGPVDETAGTAEQLLQAVAEGEVVDYVDLRARYVRSDTFAPSDFAAVTAINQARANIGVDAAQSLEVMLSIADRRYADLHVWFSIVEAAAAAEDERYTAAVAVAQGLIHAMTLGGRDASSIEKAIPVVSIFEERVILLIMGLDKGVQRLEQTDDGRSYDRLTTHVVDTGEDGPVLWFDVTDLFLSYERTFGP